MPHPVPDPARDDSARADLRMYTAADVDQLTARAGLAPARRREIQAVASLLGFRVTSYVTDELIDWSAVPDDPIYRLYFPDPGIQREAGTGGNAERPELPGPAAAAVNPSSESSATGCHRHLGERVLRGVHHSYHDTVSVLIPAGPAGSFGITRPGTHWPARGPEPESAMAPAGIPQLSRYLTAHPEVTIVEFTGADPLTMDAPALRRYLEPLLTAGHLVSIQLRTSALARWPYRFLAGPDSDELLRLFEQIIAGGKTLALHAHISHPRELEPAPAREAVRRIRGTGVTVYTHGKLAGTVNDASGTWAGMWRAQVRLGMIPHTMALTHVTGPGRHFRVTLARAQQIFAGAFGSMTGLARTVRGPAMRDEHGLVCIDGTAVTGGQQVFVLRYLQARNPRLAGTPFFAAFRADAAWLTDLEPAPGTRFPVS